MAADVFTNGVALGFFIAAPIGPVSLLCIRRTITQGRRTGIASGLGAALADALVGGGCAFALSLATHLVSAHAHWLRPLGAVVLILAGTWLALRPPIRRAPASRATSCAAAASTSFLLTIANPATVLSFAATLSALDLAGSGSAGTALALATGSQAKEFLAMNHVILTIDPSTALADAAQIVARADAIARESAGLPAEGRIGATTPAGLSERVAALGSAIRLFGADREFAARKEAPDAMEILWGAYAATGPQALSENDKITLRDQIRRRLPADVLADQKCADPTADACRKLFLGEASKYVFDPCADRYVLAADQGKACGKAAQARDA